MLEVFWDRRRPEDIRNFVFLLTFGTERLVLYRKSLSYYVLCILLCTPRNFRSRKRPCCHHLDHFLLVLIATLSVHSILRIYVTGVTAIHPIYIQAVSSQTLTATCLEGTDWNCDRNSEDDDWKENMREVREATSKNSKKDGKSKCCIFWNIVMNRVHGRLQHWYRDIIGWDLWCCIGVCSVVGKQPGRGGQPPDVWIFGQKICDLMRTFDVKVTFDATGLVPGSHYRHEFQISWISPIITVWILLIFINQFWLRKCHFFHARLCTSLDGGNLTGDTGLYIYAPWPRWEATLKQCMSLAWILLWAAVLRRSMHFNLQNWYKSICVPLLDQHGHDFIFIFSKVTGVVDIAPRSTVGPGLSLLSLGCSGGCSEASKEIMSDKEAMQSKKMIDVASPSLKMCDLGNDFCIPYNSQYLWWHVGGEWSYAPCRQSMFVFQWFLLAK